MQTKMILPLLTLLILSVATPAMSQTRIAATYTVHGREINLHDIPVSAPITHAFTGRSDRAPANWNNWMPEKSDAGKIERLKMNRLTRDSHIPE